MTDEYNITSHKLIVTWNDGRQEDLAPDLPEYLKFELDAYFMELDELRTLEGDDYNFSEVT